MCRRRGLSLQKANNYRKGKSGITRKSCPKEISKLIFENEVHKLIIEENNQGHRGHISPEELKEKFELRAQGCSDFSKVLIRRMNLYLKKHAERASTLQNLLQQDYNLR